jgi:hypothetical protein
VLSVLDYPAQVFMKHALVFLALVILLWRRRNCGPLLSVALSLMAWQFLWPYQFYKRSSLLRPSCGLLGGCNRLNLAVGKTN